MISKMIKNGNKEWHRLNPMTKKATIDECFAWHVRHIKHCDCQPMPKKFENRIKKV